MRFFNFFHAYMVQKYQNESAPIFYYGKSPKTNRKHLKIPYLQALTLSHVIKMTLYIQSKQIYALFNNLFLVKITIRNFIAHKLTLNSPMRGLERGISMFIWKENLSANIEGGTAAASCLLAIQITRQMFRSKRSK